MIGIQFPQFHRFYESFDEKRQQLFGAGIIQYHYKGKTSHEKKLRSKHLYLSGPEVLTMKHLEAGFVIWITAVCIAIPSFLIEWSLHFVKFQIIKAIVKSFFDQKKN